MLTELEPPLELQDCYNRSTVSKEAYRDELYFACFGQERSRGSCSVLSYQPERMPRLTLLQEHQRNLDRRDLVQSRIERCTFKCIEPFATLDAPDIVNDFYASCLAAPQSGSNRFSALLNDQSYLYDCGSRRVQQLPKAALDALPKVIEWVKDTDQVLIGYADGHLSVVDIERGTLQLLPANLRGGISAITSISDRVCLSATREGKIEIIDSRSPAGAQGLGQHEQRVCGLAYNVQTNLLASGGNENLIKIWDMRRPNTVQKTFAVFNAAVKALAWAPWDNGVLFAGGGMDDPVIKVLSLASSTVLASEARMQSQVVSLHFADKNFELVSSHGYQGNCSVTWKFENMKFIKLSELTGHNDRVLYSALLPDKETYVTASPDETVRLWKAIHAPKKSPVKKPFLSEACQLR